MPEQIDIPASFAGGADVTGKRVVITGASRGLGRLLAHAFSSCGSLSRWWHGPRSTSRPWPTNCPARPSSSAGT